MITVLDRFRQLVTTPTAPFREEWMMAVIDDVTASVPGVERDVDVFGNRIVRLRRGTTGADSVPVVFVAHLDHPGFVFDGEGAIRESTEANGRIRYRARFEGRVEDRFFVGSPVRLFRRPDDDGVAGRVVAFSISDPVSDERTAVIETDEDADGAVLAMWDVPAFHHRADGTLAGRACDDLAGCAAMLSALEELAEGTEPVDVTFLFSRAEEAGFCGVLCMLNEPELPALLDRDAIFVSVEISSERPGVELGGGAVIRVGDRSSTFDGRFADALWAVVRERGLDARRALMDGGTCEATAFGAKGYRTGGVCAPVRHYHNMNKAAGVIVAEEVSLSDLQALNHLIAGVARHVAEHGLVQPKPLCDLDAFLQRGLDRLAREHEPAGPTS